MLTQEIKDSLRHLSKDELREVQEAIVSLQQIFNEEDMLALPVTRQTKQDKQNDLELEFYRLAENWKHETASLSSVTKKMNHKDYIKIIKMGQAVLPFILRSLLKEPDYWFVALKKISNEDPNPVGATFSDSVTGWLQWGKKNQLI